MSMAAAGQAGRTGRAPTPKATPPKRSGPIRPGSANEPDNRAGGTAVMDRPSSDAGPAPGPKPRKNKGKRRN